MAKLPAVSTLERATPKPGSSPSTAGVGQGAEVIGREVSNIGESIVKVALEEQEKLDTTRAEDAWNKYKTSAIELSIGENGFSQKKAGDAINGDLFKDYTAKLGDVRKTIDSSLSTPEQRRRFQQRADATDLQYKEHLLRHYATERGAYEEQTFKGSVAAANALVSASPMDQNAFNSAMVNLENRANALLDRRGVTDKGAREEFQAQLRDQLQVKRLDALLYSNPIGADSLFRLVEKDIRDPELRLKMQARIREVSLSVRTTNDADSIIQEVRSTKAKPTQGSPATGQELVLQNIAFLESQPEANTPGVQRAIAEERAKLRPGMAEMLTQNTSGLPNSRDVRAQLPLVLAKVESRADALYGKDPGNPDRAAYVARLTNELKSKIQLEVVQLEAIQRESQGKLIDFISGLGTPGAAGSGPGAVRVGGQPGVAMVTSFSQIQANPEMLRAWQMTDPAAKVGLERLMEHNLRGSKGDDDLYWKVWGRIHQEPGTPGKIDFYQGILDNAGPGKLNSEQVMRLKQQLDLSGTEGGRSFGQLRSYANNHAESFFKNDPILKVTGEWLAAKQKWDFAVAEAIDKVVKDQKAGVAGADPRKLFMPGTKESMINPEYMKTFTTMTPGQALSQEAGKVRAAAAPPTQPATIKTRAELDAWIQTLPPNVTQFATPDGKSLITIPGRAAPAPAPAQPAVGGERTIQSPSGQIRMDAAGNITRDEPPSRVDPSTLKLDVKIDGKDQKIPAMVPTLTAGEMAHLAEGKAPTKEITDKAIEYAMQGGKAAPKGEEPELVDSVPRRRRLPGMSEEQINARDIRLAELAAIAKTMVRRGVDAAVSAGPLGLGRDLVKIGEALGQFFNTPMEADVAAFRQIVASRKFTAEMEPFIRGALDSGLLTEPEAARAKGMLAKIEARRK